MNSQPEGDVGKVGPLRISRTVEQVRYLLPADDELWSVASSVSEVWPCILQSVHWDESESRFCTFV